MFYFLEIGIVIETSHHGNHLYIYNYSNTNNNTITVIDSMK